MPKSELKLNYIFEKNIEVFYLDLINALFNKKFISITQTDDFLNEFISMEIIKKGREQ